VLSEFHLPMLSDPTGRTNSSAACPSAISIARGTSAWTVPDWAYAKEDGAFGNGFDGPMGAYRVLFASSQRLGCFIETLARFHIDVAVVAELALMENGNDDFIAFGTVRRAWLTGRSIGTANVPTSMPRVQIPSGTSNQIRNLRVVSPKVRRCTKPHFDVPFAPSNAASVVTPSR